MTINILQGPRASGKTTNALQMKHILNCDTVIDDFTMSDFMKIAGNLYKNILIITNTLSQQDMNKIRSLNQPVRTISIEQAKEIVQGNWN